MEKTINDIIDFIEEYATRVGRKLQEEEIVKFVKELHQEIGKMDFSVSKGTTVIAYSGDSTSDAGTKHTGTGDDENGILIVNLSTH